MRLARAVLKRFKFHKIPVNAYSEPDLV